MRLERRSPRSWTPPAAMDLSTQGLTFALVAYARLVLADGDAREAATAVGAADALRERAGMPAWPSMRRAEAELVSSIAQRLDATAVDDARAAGSRLTRADAIALIRDSVARVDPVGTADEKDARRIDRRFLSPPFVVLV